MQNGNGVENALENKNYSSSFEGRSQSLHGCVRQCAPGVKTPMATPTHITAKNDSLNVVRSRICDFLSVQGKNNV